MRTQWRPLSAGFGAVLIVLSIAGSGCTAESPFPDGATNFYESLDLASPVATVETFSEAFARKDFMTVWLAFDTKAQLSVEQSFNLLQWKMLINTDAVPDMGSEIASAFTLENLETTDRWHVFERIMTIADDHDAYLIDLSGDVTPGGETLVGDDVEVTSAVEGIDGEVRFRLVQSPSGRWRVLQVIVPGGDESKIPWSVPSP